MGGVSGGPWNEATSLCCERAYTQHMHAAACVHSLYVNLSVLQTEDDQAGIII